VADVHKGLEYKWTFSPNEVFNHPLIVTDEIVCWEMPIPAQGEQVSDLYDYFGDVSFTEELDGVGYEISNIQSHAGHINNGKIKVISLKNLIEKTFNCQWVTPPSTVISSTKKKGSKKTALA
jgi:hypothetical protein